MSLRKLAVFPNGSVFLWWQLPLCCGFWEENPKGLPTMLTPDEETPVDESGGVPGLGIRTNCAGAKKPAPFFGLTGGQRSSGSTLRVTLLLFPQNPQKSGTTKDAPIWENQIAALPAPAAILNNMFILLSDHLCSTPI